MYTNIWGSELNNIYYQVYIYTFYLYLTPPFYMAEESKTFGNILFMF